MLGQRPARAALLIAFAPVVCLALGCGGDKGYRVSGKVTFKGQPVPKGKIQFIPDASKGNKGPVGFADIKDGVYDTSLPGGNGSAGGPVIVKIEGFDPTQTEKPDKAGETPIKQLFPAYQTAVDLPKEATTKDFEVPATTPGGTGKPGEPIIP